MTADQPTTLKRSPEAIECDAPTDCKRVRSKPETPEVDEDADPMAHERRVGITCYRNPGLPPCHGILKHLVADFVVQEVGLDRQVARLQSLGLPTPSSSVANAETAAEKTPATSNPSANEVAPEEPIDPKKEVDTLATWLTPEEMEQVALLLTTAQQPKPPRRPQAEQKPVEATGSKDVSTPAVTSVLVSQELDKIQRTRLHQAIKQNFPGRLSSRAVEGKVDIFPASNTAKRDPREKSQQQKARAQRGLEILPGEGKYLAFHLVKENRETMDSMNTVARSAGINVKDITSAGIKDRRGVTTQTVTCQVGRGRNGGLDPVRMAGLNQRLHGIRLGDFRRSPTLLKVGNLYGNRFTIALRDIQLDPATAESSVQAWITNGFINYFGLQRFGHSSSATHHIGASILRGDYSAAVDLIMAPRAGEYGFIEQLRKDWRNNRKAAEVYEQVPRSFTAERAVMEHLGLKDAKDYAGALRAVPHHLLTLYLHAYQSYVWNSMVNERLERYGRDGLVPGDLVMVDVPMTDLPTDHTASEAMKVVVVDADNIDQYAFTDLVLPLPGFDIKYPTNSIAQAYVDLMQKDQLDPHNMTRNVKVYSLTGSYRRVFGQAEDVQFRFVRYSDPSLPLIATDMDRALGLPALDVPDAGPHTALILEFTLKSSHYATMCIRELTRASTSPNYNTKLSEAHGPRSED